MTNYNSSDTVSIDISIGQILLFVPPVTKVR